MSKVEQFSLRHCLKRRDSLFMGSVRMLTQNIKRYRKILAVMNAESLTGQEAHAFYE